CEVVAGDGKQGANGDGPGGVAQNGASGVSGTAFCSAGTVVGPNGPENACSSDPSQGGKGGDGQYNAGISGGIGTPALGLGQGGMGDDGTAGWTCAANNNQGVGKQGDDGGAGTPGSSGMGLGMISSNGFSGASGGDGTPGTAAQGGG